MTLTMLDRVALAIGLADFPWPEDKPREEIAEIYREHAEEALRARHAFTEAIDAGRPWTDIGGKNSDFPIRARLHENGLSIEFQFLSPHDDEVEVDGSLKWDHCMNWETNPGCMYHFCDMEGTQRLLKGFAIVYEAGPKMMGSKWMVYQKDR